MRHISIFVFAALLFQAATGFSQNNVEPAPYGPVPSERQLRWHETEFYAIIHFTPTTFENKEWGYGDADPSVFDPSDFDANQIVAAAQSGGMKGIVFVCKHHDGFCLWPTKTTDYNISKSPWKGGKGNMVLEFRKACDSLDMKFGAYVSPWDRNSQYYGKPEYVRIYREQLKEIYTGYGELFMSWHDGANGGDGFYGGAKEMRNIDRKTYYGWDSTWAITRSMQPMACIFSDAGWDVRWIGNENGIAGETCWATYSPHGSDDSERPVPGDTKYKEGITGHRDGKFWIPGECDVPLRPGWFYHSDQDNQIKSVEELKYIYLCSVGRGQCLDLGLSPDTRGQLHPNDVDTLTAFGKWLIETFNENLALDAKIFASNVRGKNNKKFGVQNLTDSSRYSYWATDDEIKEAELILSWKKAQTFNFITIRENIKLGHRIDSVAFDILENGAWSEVARITSIGALRIVELDKYYTTKKLRVRILKSAAEPCVSEIGVYTE
ncbi:MAG: alpha-L-fucosidase [Bacteroidetes bacterium GWF2_43_63]|nr:MAG: alpha-L-fucosidase [Bacteroidetes bacterium GWE2_42_42]OFY52446.1 MAG: alpha-L-fucosidase [Bacteroidetes bacterium GWF2_43_63]HBG71352.1 alpha-L-fucosidase [Bacteroidales bacterium]HCB60898.1 alpha-L-fucosidase [Bacteroidales bacterium]HCY23927.1 alpha-L-fucosidase [Bacteroidales bacterium]